MLLLSSIRGREASPPLSGCTGLSLNIWNGNAGSLQGANLAASKCAPPRRRTFLFRKDRFFMSIAFRTIAVAAFVLIAMQSVALADLHLRSVGMHAQSWQNTCRVTTTGTGATIRCKD